MTLSRTQEIQKFNHDQSDKAEAEKNNAIGRLHAGESYLAVASVFHVSPRTIKRMR